MNIGVRAGDLDQPLELWRNTFTADSEGQPITTTSKVLSMMGAVMPMRAGEKFASGREMAKTMYRIKIRFYEALDPKIHFFKWRGWSFDIVNIAPMGRMNREFMEVLGEKLEQTPEDPE